VTVEVFAGGSFSPTNSGNLFSEGMYIFLQTQDLADYDTVLLNTSGWAISVMLTSKPLLKRRIKCPGGQFTGTPYYYK